MFNILIPPGKTDGLPFLWKVTQCSGEHTRQQRQDKTHLEQEANLPCRLSFRLTSRMPTEGRTNIVRLMLQRYLQIKNTKESGRDKNVFLQFRSEDDV